MANDPPRPGDPVPAWDESARRVRVGEVRGWRSTSAIEVAFVLAMTESDYGADAEGARHLQRW